MFVKNRGSTSQTPNSAFFGKLFAVVTTPHSSAVRLNNLGVRYHTEGKFHESNVAHKECSTILEAGGPETAPLLAKSLANRAALYRTFQEYHEAERLFQIAIRIWDRCGPPSPSGDEMLSAEVIEETGLLRSFGREVERLRETKDDALRLAISKLGPWYHDVELTPEVSTNPANKQYMANRWRFLKPFVPDDLAGKSVLDIGCKAIRSVSACSFCSVESCFATDVQTDFPVRSSGTKGFKTASDWPCTACLQGSSILRE